MWIARVSLLLKIEIVDSSQPFYGQYQYSFKFYLYNVNVLRVLDHEAISERIEHQRIWRSTSNWRYSKEITDNDVDHLHNLCDVLTAYKGQFKIVVSSNVAYVYSNDLDFITSLSNLPYLTHTRVSQINVTRPSGTIALKDPKWTHRTYFRSRTLDVDKKNQLRNYLLKRENIRISPGLFDWFEYSANWNTWTQSYYFIDHNNDGEILFLNMVSPGITNRTLQIVAK
jgi:hypothetical protein